MVLPEKKIIKNYTHLMNESLRLWEAGEKKQAWVYYGMAFALRRYVLTPGDVSRYYRNLDDKLTTLFAREGF